MVHVIRLASCLWLWFSLPVLWCPLSAPTILLGCLFPWMWGISSRLLHQSTGAALYLGRGVCPLSCLPWLWTWGSSSWLLLCFISALLIMPKPLTVWITINCGKFWKRWEYQTTWPASGEICMQVRKQQLELNMNNRLVPNRERSMSRLYIVTLLI